MPGRKRKWKIDHKKVVRWAALAGALIALICHFLPPKYQTVCQTIANLCTGG